MTKILSAAEIADYNDFGRHLSHALAGANDLPRKPPQGALSSEELSSINEFGVHLVAALGRGTSKTSIPSAPLQR